MTEDDLAICQNLLGFIGMMAAAVFMDVHPATVGVLIHNHKITKAACGPLFLRWFLVCSKLLKKTFAQVRCNNTISGVCARFNCITIPMYIILSCRVVIRTSPKTHLAASAAAGMQEMIFLPGVSKVGVLAWGILIETNQPSTKPTVENPGICFFETTCCSLFSSIFENWKAECSLKYTH